MRKKMKKNLFKAEQHNKKKNKKKNKKNENNEKRKILSRFIPWFGPALSPSIRVEGETTALAVCLFFVMNGLDNLFENELPRSRTRFGFGDWVCCCWYCCDCATSARSRGDTLAFSRNESRAPVSPSIVRQS
jgi:hypothetical protein